MHKQKRSTRPWIMAWFAAGVLVTGAAHAQSAAELRIDVPVTLQHGNVVVDAGHNVMTGDAVFLMGDVNLLIHDYAGWRTDGKIVVVFHGDAAYHVLNDATYDQVRRAATGNPYSKMIAEWIEHGAQVELCGATAAANHWTNADLIDGVRVDTDAMSRVTQLEQQGYTLIYQ